MISWSSKKQGSISQSSIEVEHINAGTIYRELMWMRNMLIGLFGEILDPTVTRCNNQRCIKLSENHVFHDKLKHIEIKYHFI